MADLLNKVGVGLGAVGAGVNAVSGLLGLGADGGQSKFAVSKLTSKLGELNGLQKTSLYLVEMSVPECLSGEYGASDMETMTFLCNSAVLPGRTFAPIEYKPHGYGFRANRAGEPRVNDFTCTFFLDGKNFTLKYFNQYLNSMAYMDYSKNVDSTSPGTIPNAPGLSLYRSEYVCDITVSTLDVVSNRVLQYELRECFPLQLSDVQMEWAAQDSFESVAVAWTYKYYTFREIDAPQVSANPAGILGQIKNGIGQVSRLLNSPAVRNTRSILNVARNNF